MSHDDLCCEPLTLTPIGVVRCDHRERYEAPHQAVLASNAGVIELRRELDPGVVLDGLETFERIWVIFRFHLNAALPAPMKVEPPRRLGERVGVFATRSPHRPNHIGLSCVRLDRIEGRLIHVRELDILDGSPVLDLKPYVPFCDAFPEAAPGWVGPPRQTFPVTFTAEVLEIMAEIAAETGRRLDRYASVQLQLDPLNDVRRRITRLDAETGVLQYKRWQMTYRVRGGALPSVEVFAVEERRGGG